MKPILPVSLPGDKGPHAYSRMLGVFTPVQLVGPCRNSLGLPLVCLLLYLFISFYLIQSLQTSFRQIFFFNAWDFPFSVLGFICNFVNFG